MKPYFILIIFIFFSSRYLLAQEHVSKNVFIPDDSVYIESLERYRKIRLYLPPDYQLSDKRYPVLYMTDAQNLFDPASSYVGEWNVDETLDSLFESEGLSIIVVGIDHGNMKRINEYSPWENKLYGKADGEAFTKFLVNDLKPMIDKEYRTKSESEFTGIAGSSMGGFLSHYAIIKYPHIFSKAGIFSPSYWFSEEVFKFTESHKFDTKQKIFILIDGKKGKPEVNDVFKMEKILFKSGFNKQNLKIIHDQEAKHNESFWRAYLPDLLKFLFQ